MSAGYPFPPAPSKDAIEWPGTPIGAGNVITRTKTRTKIHDKGIDGKPGRRDDLVGAAEAHIRTSAREPVYVHDVIIHGVRVRATTNSNHLHDYWIDNWYSPEEWRAITGMEPPATAQVTVYALGGVFSQPEAAYYSRRTNTIIFFNTAYYGQLKSWVLGAVGRVLAEEYGIHSIHGACVEKDRKGILYIAPTGTGKSTSSYGLMDFPNTRFHSDDWVYVRYTYQTRDGRRIHPLGVTLPQGGEVRGYRVFRWMEQQGARTPEAMLRGLDLENREVTLRVGDLDLETPLEAYAFTSEKVFYLRTNLVENFPLSAGQMLRSKMENVPDVTDAYLQQTAPLLDDLLQSIRKSKGNQTAWLAEVPDQQLRVLLARLIAFDNARAMLDITRVLPAHRVYINPMEPSRLESIILLKRDPNDRTVLEHLSMGRFMGRLLIGETPDRKREIAYNAYRAVEDEREQAFVRELEQEAIRRSGQGYPVELLFELLASRSDVPETLQEEFELFRVMYQTCRCYDLNTVLAADPQVRDKKTAVAMTMRLIAHVVDEHPEGVRYTLDTYRRHIEAGKATSR